MKCRLLQIALFVPMLGCLLGADSISFNQGQPNPNPGGAANTLEGKGQYAVDPANTFSSLLFIAEYTPNGQQTSISAIRKGADWNNNLILAAGNYLSWGELKTLNNGNPLYSYTYGADPKTKAKVDVK